jgi:hypothetical protein
MILSNFHALRQPAPPSVGTGAGRQGIRTRHGEFIYIDFSDEVWESGMRKKKAPIKASNRDERRIRDCEGMKRDEISLGSVENGLYFGREKERMFLLQKT